MTMAKSKSHSRAKRPAKRDETEFSFSRRLKKLRGEIAKLAGQLEEGGWDRHKGGDGAKLVYDEWKNLIDDLQKVHARTEQQLFAISSILVGIDLEGRVTHWNRVAEATFAIPVADVLYRNLYRCGLKWDAALIRKGVDQCKELKKAVRLNDIHYTMPNGWEGLVGFTVNPTRDEQGVLSGFLLIGADVTERRMAEHAVEKYTHDLESAKNRIEQEQAKDAAILASIGEALIGTDSQGRITVVNEEAEGMFGWRAKNVVGRRAVDMIFLEDENGKEIPAAQRPVSVVLSTGRKVTLTAHAVLADKSRLPLVITASPVSLNGRMSGTIVIARDITKEKETDKLKTEFISTVSHELRTPLTVIKEGVSLILEEIVGPTTQDQRKFLTITLENIDRLKRIIDDVLDMSKLEAGRYQVRKETVNVVQLAQKVATAFYPQIDKAGLKLKTRYQRGSILARADKDKVVQILTNLVGNALKFTKKGYIEIAVSEKDGGVECSVADTGRGIYQKDLRKVFDKFQQCGRVIGPGGQGTGLGLSIAKGFVELHNGKIWVRSRFNKGSKFTFRLPKS